MRRGGRVVEGARLESVYTGNGIAGSNPAPSARTLVILQIVLFVPAAPEFCRCFRGFAGLRLAPVYARPCEARFARHRRYRLATRTWPVRTSPEDRGGLAVRGCQGRERFQ